MSETKCPAVRSGSRLPWRPVLKVDFIKLTAIHAQGATVLLDGRGAKVAGFERGNFLGPTVVSGVTAEMELYKQAREPMLVSFGASVRIPGVTRSAGGVRARALCDGGRRA